MPRVVVPAGALEQPQVVLRDADTLRHLRGALRLRVGDLLECGDGRGGVCAGRVTAITPRELVVAVEHRRTEPPPAVKLVLCQALIRPERFEWVLEKATELGVSEISPLVTSRTRQPQGAGASATRMRRWQRIVESACAQSGRAWLPHLHPPQPLAQALQAIGERPALVFTLLDGTRPLPELLAGMGSPKELRLFIGPEGDFSPEEVALARRCGAQAAGLGRAALRAETAALAALAIVESTLQKEPHGQ